MTEIDNETRLAVIREICNREGHGELIERTSFDELAAGFRAYICQRGCGVAVYELERALTVEELLRALSGKGTTGEIRLRGRVEVS
jgi:hypothetical protein